MYRKLSEQQMDLIRNMARESGMSEKEVSAMLRGMATMIAEHEVMKQRLVELEEIYDEVPARWRATGEPIVNLEETMRRHFEEQ